MFNSLLSKFYERKLQKVIVRYTPNNSSFIRIINHYGFTPETVLKSYIKINKNEEQDLIIASYNLEDWVRRFEFYHFFSQTNY